MMSDQYIISQFQTNLLFVHVQLPDLNKNDMYMHTLPHFVHIFIEFYWIQWYDESI